ncbi:hypothetical protein JKA74_14360 [Marivirga sp. S37H4]|uniref:Uncharacterized protein n=1 Tax=Marivirga aurantiaca TaxID=2802615 RepID=A0A934X0Q2_9BACT|nr:hypothetical protein [Marivirga aurantiaca]MBK6266225.1 hypothetical protein [Marivirga aurantiaca]
MKTWIFFLIPLIFLVSCKEEEEDNCAESIVCSDVFISISVNIKDSDGEAVVLDEFYTFIDSRTKIELDRSDFQIEKGIYPVATDANEDLIDFEGTNVVFVGKMDGENVIEHPMIIGKDCCHIKLIQGEEEIIIDEL